jgi:hypothetical protein
LAVIDTAAAISLMRKSLAMLLCLKKQNFAVIVSRLPNGDKVILNEAVSVNVSYMNASRNMTMYILETIAAPVLLGIDWCLKSDISINFDSESVNTSPKLPSVEKLFDYPLYANENLTVQPRATTWISCETQSDIKEALF